METSKPAGASLSGKEMAALLETFCGEIEFVVYDGSFMKIELEMRLYLGTSSG